MGDAFFWATKDGSSTSYLLVEDSSGNLCRTVIGCCYPGGDGQFCGQTYVGEARWITDSSMAKVKAKMIEAALDAWVHAIPSP